VGERNSEVVGVCGSSVPLVAEVVVVVDVDVEDVVDAGADDVVVVEPEGDELLEHDAISAAPAASTRMGTTRRERKKQSIFEE
jgi:hypothetical protein